MQTAITSENTEIAQRRWADFIDARSEAMRTLNIADGIKAGKTWAAFLASFEEAPSIAPDRSR